mmetsp:Transcript_50094/g.56723  ORF Transcript_50094/g.56723 Transcript_50094/m.56723 type:complete len:80 (-) Transcript_50094:214-453(-)
MLRLQQLLKKKTMTAGGDMANGGLAETKDDMAIDLTGGDLTSKDLADSVNQLGFCEIGGSNTFDLLDKNDKTYKQSRLL